MEIWKPIVGYEGRYEVSDQGRIRSMIQDPVIIMKQQTHWKGYKIIFFRTGALKRKHFVHRLVAEAFLPNPDGKSIVNHKDEDKGNPKLSNLEWMTESENILYSRDTKVSAPKTRIRLPFDLLPDSDMLEDALAKF